MHRQQVLNRHFPILIYAFCCAISLIALWQGRTYGLFPRPYPGMDQLNFLVRAEGILRGVLPDQTYKLCAGYTLFLALLMAVTGGNLVAMRILQILLCALIPVVIYKLARLLRCNLIGAQLAAFLYCLYGPAILISISFLRAAPLALCFVSFVYFLVKGFYSRKNRHFAVAGLLAGTTILLRENFIPVVFAPLLMLFFPSVRQRVEGARAWVYVACAVALVAPLVIYNYLRFGSPEVIPGNLAHILDYYHAQEAATGTGTGTGTGLGRKLASALAGVPAQVNMFLSSFEFSNSLCFYAHREIISMLMVLAIPFNLLLAMAAVALVFDLRRLRTLFVGGLTAGYFLTIIYFTMFYRFRIPVVPLLCVLAGIAFHTLARRPAPWGRWTLAAAFVSFFFVLTYANPDRLRPANERHSVARILIDSQDFLRAEAYIDRLAATSLPLGNLDRLLVQAVLANGDETQAARLYAKYALGERIHPARQ